MNVPSSGSADKNRRRNEPGLGVKGMVNNPYNETSSKQRKAEPTQRSNCWNSRRRHSGNCSVLLVASMASDNHPH